MLFPIKTVFGITSLVFSITKLDAENLCLLYKRNYGLPAVSLRYFTVFGPRQRPDMAMHRFLKGALTGTPVEVFFKRTSRVDVGNAPMRLNSASAESPDTSENKKICPACAADVRATTPAIARRRRSVQIFPAPRFERQQEKRATPP